MIKKVLFVCVENSCRSQMAEGYAKKFGQGVLEAYSSGSKPSGIVNPKAIASMKEVGVDLTTHASKGLDQLPKGQWDWVITMGCGDACPALPALNRVDWALPDPKHMDAENFAKVRDDIAARVKSLVAQAQKEPVK